MSGHSKWSTIKRKKGAADAKRGKLFSSISKEISAAARIGGTDPQFNTRLRLAIQNAKQANMPNDKVKGAIERAAGANSGEGLEEIVYEGYGPGGMAVILDLMTDNKNRTSSEIRRIFSRVGGNLGEHGCVAWNFEKKGVITLPESYADEDALLDLALEVGGEDVVVDEGICQVLCAPENLAGVYDRIQAKGIVVEKAEVNMVPKNLVKMDGDEAKKAIRFLEELEDHEDVQHAYANLDVPAEIAE